MTIKKVELHVHLEGTISPELARDLSVRNGLMLPPGLIAADGQCYDSRDFLHFLSVYDQVAGLIKSPEDYYRLTYDYLRRSALDDVIYVEMMYSPDHAEQVSGIPSSEHLAAISQAIEDAETDFGILGRILITVVRQFGVESAERVALEASRNTPSCVVGFGMGGDEVGFPPKQFATAFQIAHQEAGLLCTAHAGEFGGSEGMLEALHYLPLRRIGHGVAAIHSPEVMALLQARDISLELCPSSNVRFGLFPNLAAHPLPHFLAAGISISINSDDPPFIPTTVALEYARVQQAYQYSNAQMQAISAMAIDSAFISPQLKAQLHRLL
jgi:adenosine deaminase